MAARAPSPTWANAGRSVAAAERAAAPWSRRRRLSGVILSLLIEVRARIAHIHAAPGRQVELPLMPGTDDAAVLDRGELQALALVRAEPRDHERAAAGLAHQGGARAGVLVVPAHERVDGLGIVPEPQEVVQRVVEEVGAAGEACQRGEQQLVE